MAHFALINEENIVQSVIVINNSILINPNTGLEDENLGIEFCKSLYGQDTKWVQTSYNSNFRKNYAGIGYLYNQDLDAFIPPKPYASWILDTETYQWSSPVPYPEDEKVYDWDEENVRWSPRGCIYDSSLNAFIYPQPYPSWTLDLETYEWTPPIPYPDLDDEKNYDWDEENMKWITLD